MFIFKGSDRLCKVVELSMQYCGQILKDSFETYKTDVYLLTLIAKFDFQIIFLGGYVLRTFFKLLNNDDKKCNKNSTVH